MNAKQKKWLVIGVLLVVLGAVKIGLITHYLLNKSAQAAELPPQTLSCGVLTEGCALPGGGTLRLAAAPSYRIPFELRLAGVSAKQAPSVEFSMVGMDMGFNRYRLVEDGLGGWRAKVTLPVCTSGGHDWLATLSVDGKRYRLPLRLQ
ncbi:hypothetical protein QU487_16925 [Crenobacter sp. SG2305]|uniref:hypothetical protein n=1 Tax=Crenobacter oryzisoli TaxID=3056844 RepID=UPI0025AA7DB5|nr:hypothetical protein [Crenobacter sp. SG2305]MDN0084421.1 hypothetical protein [Crenobacter sp. SG2305]